MSAPDLAAVAASLLEQGFSHEQVSAMLGTVAPAQAAGPVKTSTKGNKSAPARARKVSSFYTDVIAKRVPCAYGVKSCGTFAPNGVGAKQHTTCPRGRKALGAARK